MESFVLTERHTALLNRMNVVWDGGEFGAPAIDQKRPYGNSDVYGDIAEICGLPKRDDSGEFPAAQAAQMDRIHREMRIALQVVLSSRCFDEGLYVSKRYGQWELSDRS